MSEHWVVSEQSDTTMDVTGVADAGQTVDDVRSDTTIDVS
jgi:hypothetical protein